MPEKVLPARPNLEQYKKQAKELARDCGLGIANSLFRVRRHHPRFHTLAAEQFPSEKISLTDTQLVIAHEHGFETWAKLARHIETVNLTRSVAQLTDPVAAFIEAACVPRHSGHSSGTLQHAEMILARYPQVPAASIYTAAILADESAVRAYLRRDPASATAKGGPHGWDALSYLCFSLYLRLDSARSEAFVRTARALLEAGASANTGWYETVNLLGQLAFRQEFESVMYGAAGVAQHAAMTRLLLEFGADPNDGETPYHVPESYDNTVMTILLESGKLSEQSLTWLSVRKSDWHDYAGMKLVLEHGADPNRMTMWRHTALHHAIRRANRLTIIELLVEHGADPALKNEEDGRSAAAMAARRGRADVLRLFEERGLKAELTGVDRLIGACACGDEQEVRELAAREPELAEQLLLEGGTLLTDFAGVGNLDGVRRLLDLGVSPAAVHGNGDAYFDVTGASTALHVAAWRAWPAVVKELLARGAPANAIDGKGRTPLALAVKACVDSYWTDRRSPESVEALLEAGASLAGIDVPCGYEAVDELMRRYAGQPDEASGSGSPV